MLMVNLILTMGTHRLHNLLKELIDAPEEGSLQELTQQAKFTPTEQEQQVLNLMAAATTANTKKHTAWLWGTVLPSVSSRAAADAAEKGHSSVPLYHAATEIEVTLKFDRKLAHNAFLVHLNVTGGQNEWAVFESQQPTTNRNKYNKVDYQTGIYAGDVFTFKTKFKPWATWHNPVPEFVQCQAFVIRKTLRRRSKTAQADVQTMQLALKFPEQLQLERWQDGSKELITQYNAIVQEISKLPKLPTPNAWALLTQLPEAQLALLSQNTVTSNANDWASPPRPKAEDAAICFK
jgi:hypothetical protein